MNPQLTDHGFLHDDCDFYEVAEEFGIDESNELGDHDFAEAPQISSGGHVREHSDSQRLPHRPKEDDDLNVYKGPTSDILTSQQEEEPGDQKSLVEETKETSTLSQNPQSQQEVDDVGNSQSIDKIKSTVEEQGTMPPILCSLEEKQQSDPKNLVEEIKEASIPSQNPQDQQQQQPPEVGKMMEEDIEDPTTDHEGKALQEVDDAGTSHFINIIKSTVTEKRGAKPIILCSLEQQSDPNNLVEEINEASIPSQNPQDQQQQQLPEVGKMMEGDIEHPTADHEGKSLQEVDDVGNSQSIDNIKSTVEEQGAMPPILCSPEEEQQSDPKKLVEEIKEASIPSQNPQNQQQQQPPEVGKMMEEDIKHPTADHEGKALQEIDDAGNSHFINRIKSTVIEKRGAMPPIVCSPEEEQQSDPNNLVKEIQEASIPSQNPQDQQQQQPPEVGKMMEEAIEHPTADHEGKALQEVGDEGNSHPINSIKSTVEEQGAMPAILCLLEEKQQSDPKKMVEEIKDASIPSKNLEEQEQQQQQPPPVERLCSDQPRLEEEVEKAIPPNNRDIDEKGDMRAIGSSRNLHPKRFFSPTKTLLSVIVSTFALIMIRKLLPRPS